MSGEVRNALNALSKQLKTWCMHIASSWYAKQLEHISTGVQAAAAGYNIVHSHAIHTPCICMAQAETDSLPHIHILCH